MKTSAVLLRYKYERMRSAAIGLQAGLDIFMGGGGGVGGRSAIHFFPTDIDLFF